MNKKIGVMGCGWLGFPLAIKLADNLHDVHGTTTSKEKLSVLEDHGITAYEIALSATSIAGDIQNFLRQVDFLIINVPPKLRSGNSESFYDKMRLLHREIKKNSVTHIIFVSSTAVYGNIEGEVTEDSIPQPATESGKQLLASEQLFAQDKELNTTIIRFGGLIGPNRHPVTMLSKRKNLTNGNDPINLIHLDDCIYMISTILANNYWREIFNAVYPLHPTKKDFYTREAIKMGITPPDYSESPPSKLNKVIVSKNFTNKSHSMNTSIIS
ncbi:NAD(P)H-binding protein [Flagellimonas sp. 2504JD1-5]